MVPRIIPLLLCTALACAPDDNVATPDSGAPPDAARACVDGDVTRERHGTDCLCCHQGQFSVAGSLELGVTPFRVVVRDAEGRTLPMAPDPHGNFFHHHPLTAPLQAWTINRDGGVLSRMEAPVQDPSCNRCHHPGGSAGGYVH
ncbi:MAG: hypothetical protein AB2A00_23660 [Myxococcota bacterium]